MHTISRPTAGDAVAIHELIAACDTAVIGAPDLTLEDVADQLAEPGFDLGRDAWSVRDEGGLLVGYAWALAKGDSDMVDADVVVRPGADEHGRLAGDLWRTVLDRAAEQAAERGHDAPTVDVGVYRADTAKQALAKEHGFEPATSFHRMRIDHDGPVEAPVPPAGVTLHTGDSEAVRREAHRVHQEGFAEHFGFVRVGYDHWYERRQAQSANDWNQLTVASVDGAPAALLIGNDQFATDEGCGYVATLTVLPAFRGRGLGRFLLRHAFAADTARGRRGTILHVDSNNATPALDLYVSAGMRQVMAIDVWRRRA